MHRHGEDALTLFNQTQQTGLSPNNITFVAVLSACSHADLVDEDWKCFNCMSQDYSITPTAEYCACMVALLGCTGYLDETCKFIQEMPIEPDASVWGALPAEFIAIWSLGEHVGKLLLEPENAGNYALLANISAAGGRWDDLANVRAMMKDAGVKRVQVCSWIKVKNRVHLFLIGDRSHPQFAEIYAMLENLSRQMEMAGYVADMNFVFYDVDEEKEHLLCTHSENLAITFGLINTSSGTLIRISKNPHTRENCHNATKFISKIVE